MTKGKENILFVTATLSMEARQNISTPKQELIHKCSFNGLACDIDQFGQTRCFFIKNSFFLLLLSKIFLKYYSKQHCDSICSSDFLTHVDPNFGSCFTFNHNRSQNLTSIKAGQLKYVLSQF